MTTSSRLRVLFSACALSLACSESSSLDEGSSALGGAGPVYFGPPLEGELGPDEDLRDNPWLRGDPPHSDGANGSTDDAGSGSGGAATKDRGTPGDPTSPPEPGVLRLDMYEETRGAEKYLGIRHLGGGPTGPAECVVEVYSNGNTTLYRRPAVPALAPGERVELCTKGASRPGCAETLGSAPFNGNDALILRCAGVVVDSFGQVGHDPGAAWQTDGVSSKDQALVRCGDERDTDPFDPFVIDESWRTWSPDESFEEARARCVSDGSAGSPGLESIDSSDTTSSEPGSLRSGGEGGEG